MAAVTGLTLVKRFTYRGDTLEEFSNTYHFKSAPPGDDASWTVLLNDVALQERKVMPPDVFHVRAYGYDSDDENAHHVFQFDWTVPGPPPPGTGSAWTPKFAGDQASCVWWKTDKLSSRGKPIYLRKYWHHGGMGPGGGDTLDTSYQGILDTYATAMNGIHGGLRARRQDCNVVAHGVLPYPTTRTLKRRGKRPRTGS